ncbi:MAG: hypothetical protein HOP07_06555 [Bacteriovoracaceae bacterium]|nr:hypothetical protein [Bacteriovoracaceae bacterium]
MPTYNYSFDDAVKEKHLVNFKAVDVRTQYQVGEELEKVGSLDTETQQQIIDDGIDPNVINFEAILKRK